MCAGDDEEICGGGYALSVYTYEGVVVELATPVGCYNDHKGDRIMTKEISEPDMTNQVRRCALKTAPMGQLERTERGVGGGGQNDTTRCLFL